MGLAPFEHVVQWHGPAVLRICRALVPESSVEDVWSETFVSALRAYPSLDPAANVEAWLVTIARRRAIDQLRSSARRPEAPLNVEQPVHLDVDPLLDSDLLDALRTLSARQRSAVVLRHVVDLSYEEVAQHLGSTPTTARRCVADAVKKLRSVYTNTPWEVG